MRDPEKEARLFSVDLSLACGCASVKKVDFSDNYFGAAELRLLQWNTEWE